MALCKTCGERETESGPYCPNCLAAKLDVPIGQPRSDLAKTAVNPDSPYRCAICGDEPVALAHAVCATCKAKVATISAGGARPASVRAATIIPSGNASHGNQKQSALWLAIALSLAANVVLGFVVADLRNDLDDSGARLAAEVSSATAEINNSVDSALSQLDEVDEVQDDVDDLETALFGFGGPPFGESDVVGELRSGVTEAKDCVNNLVRDLVFDSFFLSRCY